MRIDTEEKKLAFILGYVHALAEQHSKEFGRNIDDVKRELLEEALKKKNRPIKIF